MTPLWVPNEMIHNCEDCGISFTLLRRRHHCRLCGRVFCDDCTKHRRNLSEYGYSANDKSNQRVCNNCYAHHTDALSDLPFFCLINIASFLPTSSIFHLSESSKTLHRALFSKDCDETLWKFLTLRAQKQPISLTQLLEQNAANSRRLHRDIIPPSLQLSVHRTGSRGDDETPAMTVTDGCKWRLEYVRIVGFSGSLKCALFFVQYPIISLRIHALRRIRAQSMRQLPTVQEAAETPAVMTSFIKCLQFGYSDIQLKRTISPETAQLLLMAAACLLNVTQASQGVSRVFRENEGITTVLSLLDAGSLTTAAITAEMSSPRGSFATDLSSGSFLSSGSMMGVSEKPVSSESSCRKVVCYLAGILLNVCRSDAGSCREVCQLKGVSKLVPLIQPSQERLSVYSLECVKTCCRASDDCKTQVGDAGGVIKLINCFAAQAAPVVLAAVSATTPVLQRHPRNQLLFIAANGVNALMQVEETWSGRCAIIAAKGVSNLLSAPAMVDEFLRQRGLSRLHRLLLQQRSELAGILLGQLMNCAMRCQHPLFVQAPLFTTIDGVLRGFVKTAREMESGGEFSPAGVGTPVEHKYVFPEASMSWQFSERNSSFSEELRNSDLSWTTPRVSNSDETAVTSMPIAMTLGYGAGAIRHLMKNEDNCQLLIDMGVSDLLAEIEPFCDAQGKAFVNEAREVMQRNIESGKCVNRSAFSL